MSFCVQPLPSASQAEPLAAAALWLHWPPTASHTSMVHGLPSSHCALLMQQPTIAAPAHLPLPQTSFWVHASPSSQRSALLTCLQPLTGSHESVVQAMPSSQLGVKPGMQVPPVQTSPMVHALPSVHGPLVLTALLLHTPVVASQLVALHAVSLDVSQTTLLAALMTHLYGSADVSQINLPAHGVKFGLASQSA